MTGAELLAYAKRRLAEYGLPTTDAGREDELYELLSDVRDRVRGLMAEHAALAVCEWVTLEAVGGTTTDYQLPAATKDPLKALTVRVVESGEELSPSARLNYDGGQYAWLSIRKLRLADNMDAAAPEVQVVLALAPITGATTEAQVGLPTPCHRAVALGAAALAVTADNEGDGGELAKDAEAEIARVVDQYASFDANAGEAVRHGLLSSIGFLHGDTLY